MSKVFIQKLRMAASEADDLLTSCDASDLLDGLEVARDFMFEAASMIEELESRLAQVERERDAAVKCVYDVHEEVFKPVSATLDAEKALTNVGAIIAKWLLDTARAANAKEE